MDYKNELQSDDDFDYSNGYSDNNNSNGSSQLSKADLRKTKKPIMEKRRRARINHCLNEIKSLILEAMKKDPARYTKLEKADILEMTVKHLQSMQRQQLNMAIQTDPTVIHKFKTGFIECAEEVNRYIGQLDGVDMMVRQRLTNHLNNCATSLEQIGSMTNFNNSYRGQLNASSGLFSAALNANPLTMTAATGTTPIAPVFPPLAQDPNNNNNSNNNAAGYTVPPIQLVPSRLPTGQIVLIMPNTHASTARENLLNHSNNNNNNNNNNHNSSSSSNAAFAGWPCGINATTPTTANVEAVPLIAAATPINNFAAGLEKLSAFSKPPTPATAQLSHIASNNSNGNNNNNATITTTAAARNYKQQQQQQQQQQQCTTAAPHQAAANAHSPPPSPISSVSSHGDDSLMHTSSDFNGSRPATPPHDASNQQHSFSGVFSTPPSAESTLSTSTTSSTFAAHLQQPHVTSTSGNVSTSSSNNNSDSSANDSSASLKRALERDEAEKEDSSDAIFATPTAKKAAASTTLEKVMRTSDLKGCVSAEERDNMWRPW